jgi:predicted nuclease of predicted toxin-antitoxin system
MISILADMGVSQGVVHWLREQGHDVVHLRDQGLERLPDQEVFQKAFAEQRVVITFDLDFGEIVAVSGEVIVSVIVFRLSNARTPFVSQRLATVLPELEEVLQTGAIVVDEEGRHRVRRLPFRTGD